MRLLLITSFLFAAVAGSGQFPHEKASHFISLLTPEQKAKCQFTFESPERFNWHFVPKSRVGISLHTLNTAQTEAFSSLLSSSLSASGFRKTKEIMALETILQGLEGRDKSDSYRDPLNYYISVFATPSPKDLWGWRFEGHHISLNFTAKNGTTVASTPSFFGSNPAIVKEGERRGMKVLKDEMDLAFEFRNSMSPAQVKVAVISETALPEILSFNSRQATLLAPVGIKYGMLNETQQKLLLKLLHVYVDNYELGFSSTLMRKIEKAGIDNLTFAWAGGLKSGVGHYYRIQGPMLLIEYDNTQNDANHIHTVVRDLTNDFADDILKDHYQKEHR